MFVSFEPERKQLLGVLSILAVLFGLIGLPLILQSVYNIDAISILLVVVFVYITLDYSMKKTDYFS